MIGFVNMKLNFSTKNFAHFQHIEYEYGEVKWVQEIVTENDYRLLSNN